MTPRHDLIAQIEKELTPRKGVGGPRIGTAEQRRAFAEATVNGLGAAYTRGIRQQNAYALDRRFIGALDTTNDAVEKVRNFITYDSTGAQKLGLTLPAFQAAAAPLQSLLTHTINAYYVGSKRAARPKRGRKIEAAVEIVQMVATEYYRHFRKRPGMGPSHGTRKLPFFRVCKVIERHLESNGHRGVSIGDASIAEGGRLAATNAVRNLLYSGFPGSSFLLLSDPWGALEAAHALTVGADKPITIAEIYAEKSRRDSESNVGARKRNIAPQKT